MVRFFTKHFSIRGDTNRGVQAFLFHGLKPVGIDAFATGCGLLKASDGSQPSNAYSAFCNRSWKHYLCPPKLTCIKWAYQLSKFRLYRTTCPYAWWNKNISLPILLLYYISRWMHTITGNRYHAGLHFCHQILFFIYQHKKTTVWKLPTPTPMRRANR